MTGANVEERRRFLKNTLGLGLLAAIVSGCASTLKKAKPILEGNVLLPGQHGLDADTLTITGTADSFPRVIEQFGWDMQFDYTKLPYGATGNEADVWLEHYTSQMRGLSPGYKAQVASLGKKKFKKVDLDDLVSANYTDQAITSEGSQLEKGNMFAVKTNQGKYVKLQIVDYIPLVHKPTSDRHDNPYYNIQFRVAIYDAPKKAA